jgi:hypothetical protein
MELPAAQDSHVQVATDGSGKKVDNAALTREPATQGGTGDTVYRQRVVLADDENARLQVRVQGEAGDGALQVEAKTLSDIHGELVQIRELLQLLVGT